MPNLVTEGKITVFMNRMTLLIIIIAEETMKRLYTDRKVESNVDWLTEVVRRLSESAMDSSMNSVKMSPTRLEKVRLMIRSWFKK